MHLSSDHEPIGSVTHPIGWVDFRYGNAIASQRSLMYRFAKRKAEHIAEAQSLAAAQLAHLRHHRADISEEEALPFLCREILRLHREGEKDAHRLASRAISLLREHIQKPLGRI
jgi:hypothetical protein